MHKLVPRVYGAQGQETPVDISSRCPGFESDLRAPWKESYNKPRQRIKKQRHHFADKGPLVKAMVFPVVMYGCESWTIKKAEQIGRVHV